jgi:hypothetical protein
MRDMSPRKVHACFVLMSRLTHRQTRTERHFDGHEIDDDIPCERRAPVPSAEHDVVVRSTMAIARDSVDCILISSGCFGWPS